LEPRKALLRALKLVVSVSLIAFLIVKISPGKLALHLKNLNALYLVIAVAVFFASSILGAVQWHMLLGAGGIALPFAKTFRLYFVGLFFNNFLPANVGGDAVKIFDVVRVGNDPYRVFAITLLDRVIGITGLCFLALAASVVLLPTEGIINLKLYIIIFLGCIAPVFTLILNRRLSRGLRSLFRNVRIWNIGERFDMIFDHLGSFRSLRHLLVRLLLLALLVQFLRVATHIFVGKSLGIDITSQSFVHFYVFIPLLGLIMVLPISINGLGVREGTGILLFTQVGLSQEQSFLMEFITYVVMVGVSMVGGLFFLTRHFKSD
jgi:uncharacterized protein (TIRG00374 family)